MWNSRPKTSFKTSFLTAVLLLFVLTILMFSDVLFTCQDTILSSPATDLSLQFIHWREFGFSEMRKGNLALWNPYLFSGMPFLGGFQSALLYPLNLIYLFLPLHQAVNVSIALHILLAGVFMYLWTFRRNLHPLACFLSSILFMFSGAHFLHIYAGHLPNLCTMAWLPLVFLTIDGLFEDRSFRWCLLGIFAIAMQILAGHPQHVFYTAVSVGLYAGFCFFRAKQRIKIFLGFFIMYIGAFALTAVQVLTGIQAAQESIRGSGVSFEFASMFSFPPENLITLFVPGFFGDNVSFPYWGRCYLWEMSLFVSITGFILALYGCAYGNRNLRRFSLTMILLLFLLALGVHTSLFRFLYLFVPGFNVFRGNSKFIFQASLFIILLAGIGLDRIIRSQRIPNVAIFSILFFGGILGTSAFYLQHSVAKNLTGFWQYFMQMIHATGESYLPTEYYKNLTFIQQAGFFASKNILVAAGICLLIAALLFFRRYSYRINFVIVMVATVEIFFFARNSLVRFDINSIQPSALKKFYNEHPGDYRILYLDNPNSVMSLHIQNIWGYDPGILQRYAEFMAFTQGYNPNEANQYLNFSFFHPLYNMLRCRYIFYHKDNGINIIDTGTSMPRLLLIQDWLLIPKRDDIFATMQNPEFNPYKTVILETPPNPSPLKSPEQGTARIVDSSTDHLTIEANLFYPAILLITDAYSKGWHARALPGSIQNIYEVIPANYILRAIPLSEGHHRFRLEYMPWGFWVGKWISLISLIVYTGLVGWYFRKTHPAAFPKK